MNNSAPEHSDKLTAREAEIVQLIAEGLSSKKIALRLGISFKTVVCHRTRAMTKLDVYDTVGLLRYALRQHMIEA